MQLEDALRFDTLTSNSITGDDLFYVFDRGTNTVRTLRTDELEKLSSAAEGAPGYEEGEALLEPAGDNNDILLTSTNPLFESAEILIDDEIDRTQLSITADTPLVEIVSGDKRVMRITGELTSDGSTPFVFPDLPFTEITGGKPQYGVDFSGVEFFATRAASEWQLGDFTNGIFWTSPEDVATPDLVETWTPESPATGTPTVTAHPATAAQVIAAINAAEIEGLTAANAPGSDGSGFVAGTATVSFTIITDTPGLPRLRYDQEKLYVNVGTVETPVWKSITFDT
jgi:hypothetical protein